MLGDIVRWTIVACMTCFVIVLIVLMWDENES